MDWDFFFKAAQSFGTIALGGGALLIAYLKWKDDREKLKNELWQQRFEIYQTAFDAVGDMKIHGIENWKRSEEFRMSMHKSKFAFPNKSIYKIYYDIWDIWSDYETEHRALERNNLGQSRRDQAVENMDKLRGRLLKIDIDQAFKPFLERRI